VKNHFVKPLLPASSVEPHDQKSLVLMSFTGSSTCSTKNI